MKKIFVALTCFISICLVSCASKDIPSEKNLPEIEIPDNADEVISNIDNNSDLSSITKSSDEIITENNDELNTSNQESTDKTESNENLPPETDVLDEIDEPVVITLDPVYTDEKESLESDNSEESEQIIMEEPPEIDIIPDEKSDILETINDDVIIFEDQNNSDNSDDVIQLDNDDSIIVNNDESSIDITNDNIEDTVSEEIINEDSEAEEIIPSRKVTVKKQEYIDITYPGNGWVYMGLTDGSKDLSYFGRKLGTSDTKFTLQAKNAGTKIVHFYKNDALTNRYIDDYIEIEILTEKGSNKTHIEAPAYKQPVPKKAAEKVNKKTEVIENSVQETSVQSKLETENKPELKEDKKSETLPVTETKKTVAEAPAPATTSETKTEITKAIEKPDTNVLLEEAKLLYNEKEYKAALNKLDAFFEYATTKRDEGLYLKGQILEAKSEVQNIKEAMEAYNTLIKNYPASKHWDNSNKRIIYLKRFYFGG